MRWVIAGLELGDERVLADEVGLVELDHALEVHVERRRVGREVVEADEDQARLDAQRLDRGEAVGPDAERLARVEQRRPEPLGVLGLRVDLVAAARPSSPCARRGSPGTPPIVTSSRKRK